MLRHSLLVLFFAAHASRANDAVDACIRLHVHVYDYVHLSAPLSEFAEAEASRLLGHGIPVVWSTHRVETEGTCAPELPPGQIMVRIVGHMDKTIRKNAVGAAVWEPAESYVMVAYDRALAVQQSGAPLYSVLGKTMAHEIAHLLLGIHSHAAIGVMRPQWSFEQFRIGNDSWWFFTPRQKAAMREEMCRRSAAGECCGSAE